MSETDDEKNVEKLYTIIDGLMCKYNNNKYMISRLFNHIETLLPSTLETEHKVQIQREERKRVLNDISRIFIDKFLYTHRFYFCPTSNLYVYYDGKHYIPYSEDEILNKIHNLIILNSNKKLMVWKHKIKNSIMKQLREKSPLMSIPETETIQFIINSIYPSIFNNKNSAKYFLTIVGECINITNIDIKKNIFITSPVMKVLFDEISDQLDIYFGLSNPFHNIKYKYYDHDYNICRIIPFPTKSFNVPYNLMKYIIDFLSVSTHYFSRYGGSDNFILKCEDNELSEYTHMLCQNSPEKIVDMFINTKIKNSNNGSINTKNIFFIWKKFLEEKNLPNILLYGTLKNLLKNKIEYDEENDVFKNITSIHVPIVSQFIDFWDKYIIEDENELYLEVDEFIYLFKKQFSYKNLKNNETKITDSLIIELIKHFYPDTEIVEERYLINIQCKLWNKKEEVIKTLEMFKMYEYNKKNNNKSYNEYLDLDFDMDMDIECGENNYVFKRSKSPFIKSLYDVYEYYCKTNFEKEILINKRNFEKIVILLLGDEYLDENNLIINEKFFTHFNVVE